MADSRDELDGILEEGISGYSAAEPLAGLEERILARIRISAPSRGRMNSIGIILVAVLAGLCLSALFLNSAQHHLRGPAPETAEMKLPNSEAAVLRTEPMPLPADLSGFQHKAARARIGSTAVLPKRRVFPIPSPMTKEEHLLLVLVRRNPEEAGLAFDNMRQRADEPVEISPLTIAPLPGGEEQ